MPGLPVVLIARRRPSVTSVRWPFSTTTMPQRAASWTAASLRGSAVQLPADQPGELAGVRREDSRAAGMRKRLRLAPPGRSGRRRRKPSAWRSPDTAARPADRDPANGPSRARRRPPWPFSASSTMRSKAPAAIRPAASAGSGDRHVGRLEAGDGFEHDVGHGQPHQPRAAAQSRHAGQRRRPGHAPRSAHDQGQAEIALMASARRGGSLGRSSFAPAPARKVILAWAALAIQWQSSNSNAHRSPRRNHALHRLNFVGRQLNERRRNPLAIGRKLD